MYGDSIYTYEHITAATATTVIEGAGVLHTVTINKLVAGESITIYDATSATGATVAVIEYGMGAVDDPPRSAVYDVQFRDGLTVVTSGAFDVTVSYRRM